MQSYPVNYLDKVEIQKTSPSLAILTFILVIIFLIQPIAQVTLVKADFNEPIAFSSGLTLYSPLNITYNSNVVECNGTFDCPKGVQSSLNYSLDGKYVDGLTWSLDPDSISNIHIYTIRGSFQLPQLSDGSHKLSIGILEELFDNSNINAPKLINSTSWVNTVYFSISSNQSTNPTSASSPTVPEFSWLMILSLFLTLLSIVVFFRKKKFGDSHD